MVHSNVKSGIVILLGVIAIAFLFTSFSPSSSTTTSTSLSSSSSSSGKNKHNIDSPPASFPSTADDDDGDGEKANSRMKMNNNVGQSNTKPSDGMLKPKREKKIEVVDDNNNNEDVNINTPPPNPHHQIDEKKSTPREEEEQHKKRNKNKKTNIAVDSGGENYDNNKDGKTTSTNDELGENVPRVTVEGKTNNNNNNNNNNNDQQQQQEDIVKQIFGAHHNETPYVDMKFRYGLTDEPTEKSPEDVLRDIGTHPPPPPVTDEHFVVNADGERVTEENKKNNSNNKQATADSSSSSSSTKNYFIGTTMPNSNVDPRKLAEGAVETPDTMNTSSWRAPKSIEVDHSNNNNNNNNNSNGNSSSSAASLASSLKPLDNSLLQITSAARNPNLRIAIVNFVAYRKQQMQRSYSEELTVFFHKIGWITKKSYCDRWKYDYILENYTTIMKDDSRPLAWGKIKTLMKWLPHYDFVMWMDADAMIMNFDTTIESILLHASAFSKKTSDSDSNNVGADIAAKLAKDREERVKRRNALQREYEQTNKYSSEKKESIIKSLKQMWKKEDEDQEQFAKTNSVTGITKDLFIAVDRNGINSGVFFMRNSEWSIDFLKRVDRGLTKTECPLPETWWEQRVMMCLFDPNRPVSTWKGKDEKHVMIFGEQRLFNSYGPPTNFPESRYVKGDFVIHFPNCKEYAYCTRGFKEHFRMTLETNNKWIDKKWLAAYKMGFHAKLMPTTYYPKQIPPMMSSGVSATQKNKNKNKVVEEEMTPSAAAAAAVVPTNEKNEDNNNNNTINDDNGDPELPADFNNGNKKKRKLQAKYLKQQEFTMPPRKKKGDDQPTTKSKKKPASSSVVDDENPNDDFGGGSVRNHEEGEDKKSKERRQQQPKVVIDEDDQKQYENVISKKEAAMINKKKKQLNSNNDITINKKKKNKKKSSTDGGDDEGDDDQEIQVTKFVPKRGKQLRAVNDALLPKKNTSKQQDVDINKVPKDHDQGKQKQFDDVIGDGEFQKVK